MPAMTAVRSSLPAFLLVALMMGPLSPVRAQDARDGWSVIPTKHTYGVLVERLDAAVTANKMGLVTRASATKGAAKLGKAIPGNMIVGVYRPDFAIRMLEASVAAGIEAPIRFYITEQADGTATLSYKLPSAVFAPYEDGGQALKDMAVELDEIFAKIATQATAP